MNFLNALERIPKLVEQYKAQNVTYERDIPILQETVGGVWKKGDELKALKADVAALERKIQLTLAPPKPEDGQEQTEGVQQENGQRDSSMVATTNERLQISQERLSKQTYDSSFIREHIHLVQPKTVENETNYSRKLKMWVL